MRAMALLSVLTLMGPMASNMLAQVSPTTLITKSDGGLTLMRYKMVQKELNLTEDQVAKLNGLREEYAADVQADLAQRKLGAGGLTKESARLRNEIFKPKVSEILSPKQNERISQIYLQEAGFRLYTDPEFTKALGFTQQQLDKVAEINASFEANRLAKFGGNRLGGDTPESLKELKEIETTRDNDLTGVLTEDQKSQYAKMKGPPFDLLKFKEDVSQFMKEGGLRNRGARPQAPPPARKQGSLL